MLLASKAEAQKRKAGVTLYRVESDQKKTLKYGFFLGGHQSYYGLQYSDAFSTPDYDSIGFNYPKS